jgi:hypothetical protein
MVSTKKRLKEPNDLVVMSDGEKAYESFFASPYSGSLTAQRARGTEDAFQGCVTASKGASPTSNSSSAVRAGESWRCSAGWRMVAGSECRGSWRGWATRSLTSRPSNARTALRGG